jgi:DNA-binding MarR family transcriptional regulator
VNLDLSCGTLRRLKNEGFTLNQSKILLFLESFPESSMSDITTSLKITNARAISAMKPLLYNGFVERMRIIKGISRGRSYFIYRLRIPVTEIIFESRKFVQIVTVEYGKK